jgi:hypothetical protein
MAISRSFTPALVVLLAVAITPAIGSTEPAAYARTVATAAPAPVEVFDVPKESEPTTSVQEHPDARFGLLSVHVDVPEQMDDVAWALERFELADLELPAGSLYMHADPDDCATPDGRPRNGYMGGGPDGFTLHICTNRSVLLHELAHLWDNHVVTDELRSELLALRGLDTWRHDQWSQAGGEHLASIIAWALGGAHPTSIGQVDELSLSLSYQLITGSPPPVLIECARDHGVIDVRRVDAAGNELPITDPQAWPDPCTTVGGWR